MQPPQYIDYVHSFRGFAILNVVIIHAIVWGMMLPNYYSPDENSWLFIVNEALFHSSTLYFAVISGLLYTVVLRAKGAQTFYRNKVRNVLVPYIFCSIIFSVFTGAWGWQDSDFMQATPLFIEANEYIHQLSMNIVFGEAQITYWYIPVLLALYLLTPVFDAIVFNPKLKALTWLLILLPLIITRPPFNPAEHLVSINTIIYFSGAYVMGMYTGLHLSPLMELVKRFQFLLVSGAIVLSSALIYLKSEPIITVGLTTFEESLFYLQKIVLSLLVLYWFKLFGGKLHKPLKALADNALGIYFLHLFFLNLFLFPGVWLAKTYSMNTPILFAIGILFLVMSIALSLFVISITKKLIGRRSRLLFGS